MLEVGAPLPFDIYNAEGRLLLSRGHVVESEQQLERLFHSGRYDPNSARAVPRREQDRPQRVVHEFAPLPSHLLRNRVSVFKRLNEAADHLDQLQSLAPSASGVEAGVRSIVADLRECCTLDSDAAIAFILLSESLRHSVRHSLAAAILSTLLMARQHEPDERIDSIAAAGLTMNLSILSLQDMLCLQHEPLTDEQRESLRSHPLLSAQRLRGFGVSDPLWLQAVEQHHESRDGAGYPAGLKDAALCREAQILSLADRYCALISHRAFRPAFSPRQALKELHGRNATAIEPSLLAAVIAALGLFPPGSYVRLANGETAIVGRRLLDPKHPVVFALHQDTTAPYETPKKRLTASHRDFEIVADVKADAVRAKIDPDVLWPPTATA